MYLHGLIFSLASVWCVSATKYCSPERYATAHEELADYLGLLNNDNPMTLRPITPHTTYTKVRVDLFLTSITEVNEKAQSISTQVTISTGWSSGMEWEWWDRADFCGISAFTAMKNLFWTPDIVIQESIKTELATKESPYVQLHYSGLVLTSEILSLTTTCKMDLYKFPFDTQICFLTLISLAHTDKQIRLDDYSSAADLTNNSLEIFQTQGEWELLNINTSFTDTDLLWMTNDQMIFEITIRRRPLLYIINLIFPVFCFLVLDVASFFIYASQSEKLSFKVTLLLSISVLLLILNDMLPSTASKIPLIGIYCCVVFTLIAISILEIIFVNILIAKGQEGETKSETSLETTAAETGQSEGVKDLHNPLDTVTGRNEELTCTLNLLKQIFVEFQALIRQHQPKKASLCWMRLARIVDVTFIVIYIITIIVFLSVLGKIWFLM